MTTCPHRFVCLMSAFLSLTVLFGVAGEASARDLPDWRFEASTGYGVYYDNNGDQHGLGVSALGAWRAFDMVWLKFNLDYAAFNWSSLDSPEPGAMIVAPAVGINYDIDLLPVYPTIGVGFSPFFKTEAGEDWETMFSWHILASINFAINELVTLGLELKSHMLSGSDPLSGMFLTSMFKVQLDFD